MKLVYKKPFKLGTNLCINLYGVSEALEPSQTLIGTMTFRAPRRKASSDVSRKIIAELSHFSAPQIASLIKKLTESDADRAKRLNKSIATIKMRQKLIEDYFETLDSSKYGLNQFQVAAYKFFINKYMYLPKTVEAELAAKDLDVRLITFQALINKVFANVENQDVYKRNLAILRKAAKDIHTFQQRTNDINGSTKLKKLLDEIRASKSIIIDFTLQSIKENQQEEEEVTDNYEDKRPKRVSTQLQKLQNRFSLSKTKESSELLKSPKRKSNVTTHPNTLELSNKRLSADNKNKQEINSNSSRNSVNNLKNIYEKPKENNKIVTTTNKNEALPKVKSNNVKTKNDTSWLKKP